MKNKNAWTIALLFSPLITAPSLAGPDSLGSAMPVQVIDRDMLESTPNIRSIEDLLKVAPGITSEAEVLVNGVGSDTPPERWTASGYPLGANPFVERIEVLRSPGENVVNVVTNDKYNGRNIRNSWVLSDMFRDLSKYWFTVESREECDATSGSETPHWNFSPEHDYGMPKISMDGDLFRWGSQSKGYDAGSLYSPQYTVIENDDWLRSFGPHTYDNFEKLQERINNDPDEDELDKRHYLGLLQFGAIFGGPGALSDQGDLLNHFDPEKTYRDFKKWAAERTDADRADFGSSLGTAPTPGPAPAPAPEETAANDTPSPFDEYPYPPDYAFDFGQCSSEQKDKVLQLTRERDQARADISYYMDYLRRPGQTAQDVKDDEARADEARKTRDTKNEELREFWRNCTNPETASAQAAPNGGMPEPGGDGPGYLEPHKWNLELHLEYKSDAKDPEPDIGFDAYEYNYGLKFALPFSAGGLRDVELGAGAGTKRAYADKNGVARIEDAIELPRPRIQFSLEGTADNGLSFGGTPVDRGLEGDDDWQIFADYDFKGLRGGPTIGLKYKYEPVDSVYQEVIPDNSTGAAEQVLSDETQSLLEGLNKYGSGFLSFGGRTFRTYTFPENGGFNYDALDEVPGQTYWTNNECGDSALPPEAGGYLTAEQSPVKSVDDQWALKHVGLSGDEPTLDEFAKPVVVGVIDTGVDWNHMDFAWDNLWRNDDEIPGNGIDDDNNGFVDDIIGWNFTGENNRPWDNDGHGTFVAGIIAATQGNDAGIDGINGSAKIMVLKALNNFGRTRASYIAQAIVYGADNGAQILNLSVTGPGFPKIVQDAVNYAESKGVLVINAAGNRAEDIDVGKQPPLQRVLTVAATGPDDKRAAFSNVGNAVDIAAPGIDVVSLRARATDFMYNSAETTYVKEDAFLGEDKRYYRSTGTSFATPIVTGIASLVLANNPGLKPAELKRVLVQSARDIETPGMDLLTGYGIVDARAALAADPAFYVTAAIALVRSVNQDGYDYVQVGGIADAEVFGTATLEIGQGEDPESWTQAGVLSAPVQMGELGRIPVEQFEGAPTWTIRLTVTHLSGRSRESRHVIDL